MYASGYTILPVWVYGITGVPFISASGSFEGDLALATASDFARVRRVDVLTALCGLSGFFFAE